MLCLVWYIFYSITFSFNFDDTFYVYTDFSSEYYKPIKLL